MYNVTDEQLILSQLISNKSFYKKAIFHIKAEYFEESLSKRIFNFIKAYSNKYSDSPQVAIVKNALTNITTNDSNEEQYIHDFDKLITDGECLPFDVILDKAEEYIKNKALYLAITQSVLIFSGEDSKNSKESIPTLVKEALAVTLDDSVGDFYFEEESAIKRKKEYSNKDSKVKFKLDKGNEVTNDGVMKKSLHCIVAGPNVGKTAMMIGLASDYIELGYNVMYVTCEMSEAQIGIRFDARFLNYETSEIPDIEDSLFVKKIGSLKDKSGSLLIKGYETNELTAQKLDSYVEELDTKYNYKPDVIFIDYIGICSSYMLKDRGNIGTYYTKVAEEFRSFAQRKDVALWTAQQMTTESLDNTDPTLKNIGYGQGIAKTADMVWFVIRTEELDALGQLLVKQDKTRYHKQRVTRFNIGFDIGYMKLYNVDNTNVPISTALKEHVNKEESKATIATAFNKIKKR